MDEIVLTTAVGRIRQRFGRARVLLFGSSARGTDTRDSDIDLCVIIEDPKHRLLEISRGIREDLYPIFRRPLDILVYDKKTFDERSSLNLTMEAEIAEQGREL